MDKVLSECSFYGLIKQVENMCTEYFNCERATLVLIHRFNRHMYRIEHSKEPVGYRVGEVKGITRHKWDLNQGFAGFIGMSGKAVII